MQPNLEKTADLVTFTEEIFNGKLHFLCSIVAAIKRTTDAVRVFMFIIF